MTNIDSQGNNDGLQGDQPNEPNQIGSLEQSFNSLAILTQNGNPQGDNNNNSNQIEQPAQSNSDFQPLETTQQETNGALDKIASPKGASSTSSTSLNSPKQTQSSTQKEKKKTNQQSKSPKNEEPCEYTEEELDEHIENIKCRRTPPPKELRNPILQLLNRRRVQALVDGDYDLAEEQENNIKIFYRVTQSEDNKSNEDAQFEILFNRYQQLQKDQQDITAKWDEKINKYNEDEEQFYNDLLQKHQKEKDTFHSNWSNPEYLRPFTKPSPKLNSMREQERAMAVARMYQQAKVMKQSADRLQKEETAAAQQRISKTMEVEWNRMLERHEIERKKFIDHKNKNVAFLESEKQKELKATMNAINQIKSKKGLLLNTKHSSAAITKSAQDIEAQSPRTHKKYANFKSEKKKPKLAVQPVTDQEFLETKKTTRTKSRLSKTQSQKQDGQQPNQKENLETTGNQSNPNELPPENSKENELQAENNDQNENTNENASEQNENENENNNQESIGRQFSNDIMNKASDVLDVVAEPKKEDQTEEKEGNENETEPSNKTEDENKIENI